jgi:hypothetical protein
LQPQLVVDEAILAGEHMLWSCLTYSCLAELDWLACLALQVNKAVELYPQHADSLELKKQLRSQLNAV